MNEINNALDLPDAVKLGSDDYFKIERIPTGSLVLDRVTGGGFALGRHYECFGDENSGKSYIVYRTMALSQQRGNLCAIVDPEHSFDGERFVTDIVSSQASDSPLRFLGKQPVDRASLAFVPADAAGVCSSICGISSGSRRATDASHHAGSACTE